MIHQRRPPQTGYLKRRFPKWEKSNKSIYYFFVSTSILILMTCLPFVFLTNENYYFFQSLAVDTSPSLLGHLEREQLWFNIAATTTLLALCFANGWFAVKLVHNFRSQVHAFDRHLKHLIRGEWFVPALRIRENDDFKDLAEQYGYFYKSLQAMTKAEIQILEKMNLDPSQRENYTLWKMLLQQKRSRLGYEEVITENVTAANSSVFWKRVS